MLVAGSNSARATKNYQKSHEFRILGFLRSSYALVAMENAWPCQVRSTRHSPRVCGLAYAFVYTVSQILSHLLTAGKQQLCKNPLPVGR